MQFKRNVNIAEIKLHALNYVGQMRFSEGFCKVWNQTWPGFAPQYSKEVPF